MKHLLLAAAAASLALPVTAQEPAPIPSPGEIAAAAPASDWIAIAPSDLLVMDLAPDANGKARRVVIQLMPAPFSQGWIGNIRKLAAAHWWDGTSVNRVQDNYVVQWGDATEKKALPAGLVTVPERGYVTPLAEDLQAALRAKMKSEEAELLAAFRQPADKKISAVKRAIPRDPFADETIAFHGWAVAVDRQDESGWPVHCYGMVGVGRNLSPDTGSGAELYTVIGHAPRHLDQNIALVGRVISGIEHLSSLPRGTGALGFYEDEKERVPIASIRIAGELAAADQPRFEYLSTESDSFARYADARANRRDPFFIKPAGGADICNIPVPVRAVAK
ncbi:peptidylprolyl isomerase [Sphingopyxis sp.]|jgi:peptidylprolyl isomerase|uniref:peptidylprolyl isomerase n=1 Tax=Sphingopyxis sp. TaxID=1908224 RepID=UPI003F70881D